MADNEIFYALFGKIFFGKFFIAKIDFYNEGTPASVEFNYNKVIDSINKGNNLLGFYHTHPNMPAYMSGTDMVTMDSWTLSEGKNLLSIIHGDNGTKVFECGQSDDNNFNCKEIDYETGMFFIPFLGNFILGCAK